MQWRSKLAVGMTPTTHSWHPALDKTGSANGNATCCNSCRHETTLSGRRPRSELRCKGAPPALHTSDPYWALREKEAAAGRAKQLRRIASTMSLKQRALPTCHPEAMANLRSSCSIAQ